MKVTYNNLILKQLISENPSQFIERLAIALDHSNYNGDIILDALVEGVIKNVCVNNEADFETWKKRIRNNNPSLTITFKEPQRNTLNDWVLPYVLEGECFTKGQYDSPVKSGSAAEATDTYKHFHSYNGQTNYISIKELGDIFYLYTV